ncbi:hypothetical protein [Magnetospirillum sp. SS-4]|uniref:hypothetical protein n=1 Tax=Magnetospirillum sp. SS-4 TaxID=2681465 RepID=UPI00137FEBF6|nr:hypothetical protein [Magnetospirillum sp. SS-4]CAA7623343.1 conserved hypothetical protein [Magnetospirillum sp. SS-4]
MGKYGPQEGPCDWDRRNGEMDVEELHKVLNCASERGCNQCVRCSERALEKLLVNARQQRTFGSLGLERLELEMDMSAAFGM